MWNSQQRRGIQFKERGILKELEGVYLDALAASQLIFFPTFAVAARGMKRAGAAGARSSRRQLASRAAEEMKRHRLGSASKRVLMVAANNTSKKT